MNNNQWQEWAEIARENWEDAFSKMPSVPYLEAALRAIAHAAQEPTRICFVEDLCEMMAFAARETAFEAHGIDYLDNELREALEHKAKQFGWEFLREHLQNAAEEAQRWEQERMPVGDENADDTH